jgi:hypothetical protein
VNPNVRLTSINQLLFKDFRDLPVRVKFGFETKRPMIEFYTPYALCYPANTRAKGCQVRGRPCG